MQTGPKGMNQKISLHLSVAQFNMGLGDQVTAGSNILPVRPRSTVQMDSKKVQNIRGYSLTTGCNVRLNNLRYLKTSQSNFFVFQSVTSTSEASKA